MSKRKMKAFLQGSQLLLREGLTGRNEHARTHAHTKKRKKTFSTTLMFLFNCSTKDAQRLPLCRAGCPRVGSPDDSANCTVLGGLAQQKLTTCLSDLGCTRKSFMETGFKLPWAGSECPWPGGRGLEGPGLIVGTPGLAASEPLPWLMHSLLSQSPSGPAGWQGVVVSPCIRSVLVSSVRSP